ncbi:hypothetical protein AB0J82_36810 [Asanoa sp. NPDC049518]|uniref:hypothetical protein n=1 Tax=unclassified Asanoa TaxID=2685164 RepID=UPI00343D0B0A
MSATAAAEPTPQPPARATATPQDTPEGRALTQAAASGEKVLVEELTSPTRLVWALPDGQFEARLDTAPERLRRDGQWVPVDLTLERRPDGVIASKAHPHDLQIAGAVGAGDHDLAKVVIDGESVAMGWRGSLPEPLLSGPKATYPEVMAGVDLVLEATVGGVEQFFVVRSPAAAAMVSRLTIPLRSSGLRSEADGGGLMLRNQNGVAVAAVPEPEMWDSRIDPLTGDPARTAVVSMSRAAPTARGTTGTDELVLTPDLAWMTDSATVWPVTIDPAISSLGTTFDTYVREDFTGDRSGQTDLQVGRAGATGPRARSFIGWDISTFTGGTVSAASVFLWNFYSQTCTPTEWQVWTTGTASTSTRWTSQPAWEVKESSSTQTKGFDSSCDDAAVSASATSFFNRAAQAGKTTAFMGLKAANEDDVSYFRQYRSRDYTTAAQRPYATVTYNAGATVSNQETVPATTCVTGASRPVITAVTPTLSAKVTDPEAASVKAEFEWWATGGSKIGGLITGAAASGSTLSAPIPTGALANGGTYSWRARGNDGAGSGKWSSWCEFQVSVGFSIPVAGCAGSLSNDFNADGVRDTAIADYRATVAGQTAAGAVYLVDGNTGTAVTLDQSLPEVPGNASAGAEFGRSLSVFDANMDGCADLAVGAPNEDLGGLADVGAVYVLYGSPAGVGKGTPSATTFRQAEGGVPGTPATHDLFGFSIAAGVSSSGTPFLVVGAPGETVDGKSQAGATTYLRPDVKTAFDQSLSGGSPEADDQGGFAITASPSHFAVSFPGESVDAGTEFGGTVCVFSHSLSSGKPASIGCVTQNSGGISETTEAGDQFGRSIAMAPYWPEGDSLLAVGVPGEDADAIRDVGMVHQLRVSGASITEVTAMSQGSAGLGGSLEEGDQFGQAVALVNTNPAVAPNATTLQIAVGAPGEDNETTSAGVDSGAVHVFAAGATLIAAKTIERAPSKLPGNPAELEFIGISIGASPDTLLVSAPFGAAKAVWALRWDDLAVGTTIPSGTFTPGNGGIPADAIAFGYQVR